jgi:hypothetical protein
MPRSFYTGVLFGTVVVLMREHLSCLQRVPDFVKPNWFSKRRPGKASVVQCVKYSYILFQHSSETCLQKSHEFVAEYLLHCSDNCTSCEMHDKERISQTTTQATAMIIF